jgi:Uma2 family endonuclease
MPQPDAAVLAPRDDDYYGIRPLPKDVLLLVEVAVSSLEYDRKVKLPLYASAGVPEVWILDLTRPALEAYSGPSFGGYTQQTSFDRSGSHETIAARALPHIAIRVGKLLPP